MREEEDSMDYLLFQFNKLCFVPSTVFLVKQNSDSDAMLCQGFPSHITECDFKSHLERWYAYVLAYGDICNPKGNFSIIHQYLGYASAISFFRLIYIRGLFFYLFSL